MNKAQERLAGDEIYKMLRNGTAHNLQQPPCADFLMWMAQFVPDAEVDKRASIIFKQV